MATKKKPSRKVVRKSKPAIKSVVHQSRHYHAAKSIIPLFVLLLAFGIFGLFYIYQQNIISSNSFNLFMVLSVVAMALLAALLFLINPQKSK